MLSRRAEELLSYFTGLAPVGTAFCAPAKQCVADLKLTDDFTHQLKRKLCQGGFVRPAPDLLAGGRGYVVLRRLEGAEQ